VPFFGSVSNFKEAQQAIQTAVASFGRIDIVVNNAGSDAPKMVWNMSEEEWDVSINSYLKSSFNCIRQRHPSNAGTKVGIGSYQYNLYSMVGRGRALQLFGCESGHRPG